MSIEANVFSAMQKQQSNNNAVKMLLDSMDGLSGKDRKKEQLEMEMLQLRKQNLLQQSKLANDRFTFEKEKYYQEKEEKLANEEASLNGIIAASGFDLSTPETETVKEEVTTTVPGLTESGQKEIQAIMAYDDKYQEREIDQITPENRKLLDDYNKLELTIKDPTKLRIAQLEFAKNHGLYDDSKSDSGIDVLAKKATPIFESALQYNPPVVWYNMGKRLYDRIAEGKKFDFEKTEEELLKTKAEEDAKQKDKEESLKIIRADAPLQKKLEAIRKKEEKIKQDKIYNEGVKKDVAKLLNSMMVPTVVKDVVTKENVIVDRNVRRQRLNEKTNNAIKSIRGNPKLNRKAKDQAIIQILAEKKRQEKLYDDQLAAIKAVEQLKTKARIDVSKETEIAKNKAKIKALQDELTVNPSDKEAESQLLQLKLKTAQLEYDKKLKEA